MKLERFLTGLGLAVLAILAVHVTGGTDGLFLPFLVGAVATYTPSTSGTDLNTVWRKVQTPLQIAAQFAVDEWDMLDDIPSMNVDLSAREITMPVDLKDEVGIASIPEGGYEARPGSQKPRDATLTWIFLNGRITLSRTAQILDQSGAGKRAMIARQLLYQGQKKLQAMQRKIGDMFYGFSDAVAALVNGAPAADVFTLDSMYGRAGLGEVGSSRVVTDLFRVGEYVMVAELGGSTYRGVAKITAVTAATPSITLDSTPGSSADNDEIIFANSLENGTNAASSDVNKGLVGLLEIATATSVHSLSKSTETEWDVAHSDTTGGRLTGVRIRRGVQQIRNKGGVEADTLIYTDGVENDMLALYQASVRFTDGFNIQVDGNPKFRGLKIMTSRFCPEGCAFLFNKSKLKKLNLVSKPDAGPAWGDGHKLQDQSGFVFPFDFPLALVCTSRRAFAFWESLTEQV